MRFLARVLLLRRLFLVCFVGLNGQNLSGDLYTFGLVNAGEFYVYILGEWGNGSRIVLHFQFGGSTGQDGLGDLFRGGASAAGPAVLNNQGLAADVLDLKGVGDGLSLFDLAEIMFLNVHFHNFFQLHLSHGSDGNK